MACCTLAMLSLGSCTCTRSGSSLIGSASNHLVRSQLGDQLPAAHYCKLLTELGGSCLQLSMSSA